MNWLVKWFLPFCLLAFLPSSMQAQVNNNKVENQEEEVEEIDDEEDEDDEDASTDFTVPVEDELTITDKDCSTFICRRLISAHLATAR